MSKQQHVLEIQTRIRRSSSFSNKEQYPDWMSYAKFCRDELDVLAYMQENSIGVNQPQFWIEKLTVLKDMCQYKEVAKILLKCKKKSELMAHEQFFLLLEFEENIIYEMTKYVRQRRGKRRRSTEEFQLFSLSKIQRSHRKIGKVDIYVDEDCRQNYVLEDYADFFDRNLKEQCKQIRNDYLKNQQQKPLSFLGVKKANLQKWSLELIGQNLNQIFKQKNSDTQDERPFCQDSSKMITPKNTNTLKLFKISQKKAREIETYETPSKSKKVFENPQSHLQKDSAQTDHNPKTMFTTPKQKMKDTINYEDILLKKPSHQSKQRIDQRKSFKGRKSSINFPTFQDTDIFQKEKSFEQKESVEKYRISKDPLEDINVLQGKPNYVKKLTQQQQNKINQKHTYLQNLAFSSLDCHQLNISLKKQFPLFQQDQNTLQRHSQYNKLTETQTFGSIVDSNQENIFSDVLRPENTRHQERNDQIFIKRETRRRFQILKQDDLSSIKRENLIDSSQSTQNRQNFIFNNVEDDKSLKEIVHELQHSLKQQQIGKPNAGNANNAINVGNPSNTTNIVLETLRKKKMATILADSVNDQHAEAILNSEKQKKLFNVLQHVSEEKSFNSQHKRLSSLYLSYQKGRRSSSFDRNQTIESGHVQLKRKTEKIVQKQQKQTINKIDRQSI